MYFVLCKRASSPQHALRVAQSNPPSNTPKTPKNKLKTLWKAYIDFELEEGEEERTRALYERLLERTQHVKVWISFAQFEADNGAGVEVRLCVPLSLSGLVLMCDVPTPTNPLSGDTPHATHPKQTKHPQNTTPPTTNQTGGPLRVPAGVRPPQAAGAQGGAPPPPRGLARGGEGQGRRAGYDVRVCV